MNAFPVIDSHCHTSTDGLLAVPGEPDVSLVRYALRALEAGITQTVLMAPPVGDYAEANHVVRDVVEANPGRYLPYVFVNPTADRGRLDAIVGEALRWGIRGIKVHWSDGEITSEVGEVATRYRLPVLYDPYGDLTAVCKMTRTFPDVAWIIPHLSSFADNWKAQVGLIDELTRTANLFTDTAGVRYFDLLADAIQRAGAAKVLFGSDGPYLHPGVELAKVKALKLNSVDYAKVVGGNLIRLAGRTRIGLRRRP